MRLDFVCLSFRISANIYDYHKEQSPVWNEKLRETLSEMAFFRDFLFLNGWFQAYVYWKLTGVSYWLPSPQKNCWVSWCCSKSYAFVYGFFYHCISSCDNWVPLVFLIFLQHTTKLHQITSIYMRLVAVLKFRDRWLLNSWQSEQSRFFAEEKRVKLGIKNLLTNLRQTINLTKTTKIFYILALIGVL